MTTVKLPILGHHVFVRQSDGQKRENILFVHGVGASGRYWLPLARKLGRSANLYIPDFPGHGRSSKPHNALTTQEYADLLHRLIQKLGLQQLTLVGNSFGCQIIIDMLHRYGTEQVSRAVLLGPTVNRYERSVASQAFRLAQDALHEPPLVHLILLRDYIDSGPRRLLQGTVQAVQDQPEAKLGSIRIPVLVVRGRQDKNVPSWWADELVEGLPHARLEQFGSGHAVHINASAQTAGAILSFMGVKESRKRKRYHWLAILLILATFLSKKGRAK